MIASAWQRLLGAAGASHLRRFLNRGFDPDELAGSWTALTKPGLGGRQRWRWELPTDDGAAVVYVKRYGRTPLREQLDRLLRQFPWHSRAWWEYRQSVRLSEAYLPVPEPVGVVESMVGPFERRSAVLLRRVPGNAFDRVWRECEQRGAPITRGLARLDMIRRLGRFVSAFHQTSYCHRDLYLCHIFVDLDPDGRRPPSFALIDLARTHRPHLRRMRWVLKDLSQLDYSARRVGASRADRLRLLEAYLSLPRGAPRVRWFAVRVARRSDAILRREIRKGRA